MIMMNSNAMDVTLTNETMRFSIVGGVLDMYFLMGPSPLDVTDQLTQIVGRPILPPYWSLGFMQSKYAWLAGNKADLPSDVPVPEASDAKILMMGASRRASCRPCCCYKSCSWAGSEARPVAVSYQAWQHDAHVQPFSRWLWHSAARS